ncbi:VOC family protein [Leifsonia sp. NPDC058194]|uniref:VOC family protein n=1 Tax=Leifsonia sp. NPDC058194 TaxID=3346374 RepID=UPI0036D7C417
MSISVHFVDIIATDPAESLVFYRDALGLDVLNDVAYDGHHWITMGVTGEPGSQIVISDPYAGRPQADGDALAALVAKGTLPGVVFSTDDVDGLFERVRAYGAEVLQEPIDQFYGSRDCAFRDPAGNMVKIQQWGVAAAQTA